MKLLKDFFTVGIGTILNILLSFFSGPILTRIVDPAENGKLTMFNTYVGIMTSLFYFGLNEALLRFFYSYKEEKDRRKLLKLCVFLPASVFAVVFAFAMIAFTKGYVKTDYSLSVFVLLFLCIFFTILERMSNEMLQNTFDSKKYSLAIVLKKAIYCIGSIIFLKLSQNSQFYILALLTTVSVFVSASIGIFGTKTYWKFSDIGFPDNMKEIMQYSLPMYIYFFIYSLYDSIDKLFIERFCTDEEIGIYGAAFALVGVYSVVHMAFKAIWQPAQTKHYTENPDDMTFIQKGNRYITIIMLFIGINTMMFKDLICFFLGESYRSGSRLIPFLVFNPIMNTMIWTVTSGIEISQKSYLKIIIIVMSLVILSVGSVILIPLVGIKGSGISVAISLIAQYYLTVYFSNKNKYADYGIMKLNVVLVTTIIFACVTTFCDFGVITIVTYAINMSIFFIVYWIDIKEMVIVLTSLLKNRND